MIQAQIMSSLSVKEPILYRKCAERLRRTVKPNGMSTSDERLRKSLSRKRPSLSAD